MQISNFYADNAFSNRLSIGGSLQPTKDMILTFMDIPFICSNWKPENGEEITFLSLTSEEGVNLRLNSLFQPTIGTVYADDGSTTTNQVVKPEGFLTTCITEMRKAFYDIKRDDDDSDDDFAQKRATAAFCAFFKALYNAKVTAETDLSKKSVKVKITKVTKVKREGQSYFTYVLNTEKLE